MTLPKPDLIILIDRLIEGYKRRHDNSEFIIQITLCGEIVLDLEDIKKLAIHSFSNGVLK